MSSIQPAFLSRQHWQQELANAITDPRELVSLLELPQDLIPGIKSVCDQFSLRVPTSYLSRIEKGNPADPLLLQILPVVAENFITEDYNTDPVGDLEAMTRPGLLQKYQGRVLIMATGACGIHCRYCFRRHFPYAENGPSAKVWQNTCDYVSSNTDIEEVILSGGDPLCLKDESLATMIQQLENIPHLQRIRIHSRMPVVIPSRVSRTLIETLSSSRLQAILVTHVNHPNEIDADVTNAMKKFSTAGITLLNQSVLLRNINDSSDVLCQLSKRLFESRILPYYLHQLDKVQGAAHFAVDETTVTRLICEVRAQLPGYLVPKLVREIPGKPYKQPL